MNEVNESADDLNENLNVTAANPIESVGNKLICIKDEPGMFDHFNADEMLLEMLRLVNLVNFLRCKLQGRITFPLRCTHK